MKHQWRQWVGQKLDEELWAASLVFGAFLLAVLCANTTAWYEDWIAQGHYWLSIKGFTEHLLMPLFFLYMGMEIQKERTVGILSQSSDALWVPVCAAAGGMLVPAAVYLLGNIWDPAVRWGWGIPAATDIVFALCAFDLWAKKLPKAFRVFLLTVALCDDLGAIAMIAVVYRKGALSVWGMFAVLVLLAASYGVFRWLRDAANSEQQSAEFVYAGVGGLLLAWIAALSTVGVHTTLAGILVALCLPCHKVANKRVIFDTVWRPLVPVVNYAVLPLFAFTAGGFSFAGWGEGQLWHSTVFWGIVLGLFVGKPLGITGVCYLIQQYAPHRQIPGVPWEKVVWWDVCAVGMLCGMGFTMSLLIAQLAFSNLHVHLEIAKAGVFFGSAASALLAASLLLRRR